MATSDSMEPGFSSTSASTHRVHLQELAMPISKFLRRAAEKGTSRMVATWLSATPCSQTSLRHNDSVRSPAERMTTWVFRINAFNASPERGGPASLGC
jgi:hypothetical protein